MHFFATVLANSTCVQARARARKTLFSWLQKWFLHHSSSGTNLIMFNEIPVVVHTKIKLSSGEVVDTGLPNAMTRTQIMDKAKSVLEEIPLNYNEVSHKTTATLFALMRAYWDYSGHSFPYAGRTAKIFSKIRNQGIYVIWNCFVQMENGRPRVFGKLSWCASYENLCGLEAELPENPIGENTPDFIVLGFDDLEI